MSIFNGNVAVKTESAFYGMLLHIPPYLLGNLHPGLNDALSLMFFKEPLPADIGNQQRILRPLISFAVKGIFTKIQQHGIGLIQCIRHSISHGNTSAGHGNNHFGAGPAYNHVVYALGHSPNRRIAFYQLIALCRRQLQQQAVLSKHGAH